MSMDRKQYEAHEVADKSVFPVAAYTMSVRDQIVRPAATPASGAFVLTLPPVAEARGLWFSIICRNADAVNTVTVADQDDSECWAGDVVLNGKCDRLLLFSDGMAWHQCCTVATFTGTTAPPTTAAPTTDGA